MNPRRTLPAVVLAIAILGASGPWASSDATGPVARSWLEALGLSATAAEVLHEVFRKCGHFLAYGSFAWLVFWGLRTGRPTLRLAGAALLLAIGLASLDEALQSLSPGRTGTFRDVLLDTAGASVFLAHALLRARDRGATSLPADATGAVPASE